MYVASCGACFENYGVGVQHERECQACKVAAANDHRASCQYSPMVDPVVYKACDAFESEDWLELAVAALDQYDGNGGDAEILAIIKALESRK